MSGFSNDASSSSSSGSAATAPLPCQPHALVMHLSQVLGGLPSASPASLGAAMSLAPCMRHAQLVETWRTFVLQHMLLALRCSARPPVPFTLNSPSVAELFTGRFAELAPVASPSDAVAAAAAAALDPSLQWGEHVLLTMIPDKISDHTDDLLSARSAWLRSITADPHHPTRLVLWVAPVAGGEDGASLIQATVWAAQLGFQATGDAVDAVDTDWMHNCAVWLRPPHATQAGSDAAAAARGTRCLCLADLLPDTMPSDPMQQLDLWWEWLRHLYVPGCNAACFQTHDVGSHMRMHCSAHRYCMLRAWISGKLTPLVDATTTCRMWSALESQAIAAATWGTCVMPVSTPQLPSLPLPPLDDDAGTAGTALVSDDYVFAMPSQPPMALSALSASSSSSSSMAFGAPPILPATFSLQLDLDDMAIPSGGSMLNLPLLDDGGNMMMMSPAPSDAISRSLSPAPGTHPHHVATDLDYTGGCFGWNNMFALPPSSESSFPAATAAVVVSAPPPAPADVEAEDYWRKLPGARIQLTNGQVVYAPPSRAVALPDMQPHAGTGSSKRKPIKRKRKTSNDNDPADADADANPRPVKRATATRHRTPAAIKVQSKTAAATTPAFVPSLTTPMSYDLLLGCVQQSDEAKLDPIHYLPIPESLLSQVQMLLQCHRSAAHAALQGQASSYSSSASSSSSAATAATPFALPVATKTTPTPTTPTTTTSVPALSFGSLLAAPSST